ncbi:MAG TPA: flavin reductase [Rhizobium sp.]
MAMTMTQQPEQQAYETLRIGFRNAMSRLAAAVNIVTTDGPGGRTGFAATAVCSVSDNPPSLVVCINRSSSAYRPVIENRVLCVNVTGDTHQPVCQLFGGKTPAKERFAQGAWTTMETGAPVLENALEAFDCRISEIHSSGSHDLLVCEVLALKPRSEGRGLIYFERAYHSM